MSHKTEIGLSIISVVIGKLNFINKVKGNERQLEFYCDNCNDFIDEQWWAFEKTLSILINVFLVSTSKIRVLKG